MNWQNVYIFISSTFNDMHAERDYLVKKVFPKLSAWCEERKLRLIDIDLRWGVSETDATQNKRVVQVCLDRINACRPFFLCFLGQRRGWVPDKTDINDDTYKVFPKLAQKYVGHTSVTEMEILHALVDPLQNEESAEYSFFYLRAPHYLNNIKNDDLLNVYTNRAEQDSAKADAQLEKWRNEIIPTAGRPFYFYAADWNENETTHEIALPLYCPTTAPVDSDAWKATFVKWSRMWQLKGVSVSDNGEISDAAELLKAQTYNKRLTQGRLTGFKTEEKNLADVIIENLKEAITARFGERTAPTETPLQKELDQQAQFLQIAAEGFIERIGDFDAINAYLANKEESRPFAITAFAGMGKTSLLAHFINAYQLEADEMLYYRFIGGSDNSVCVKQLIHSLLNELKEDGKIVRDIPEVSADMIKILPELLAEAGRKCKIILVIDALNQLESGMSDLLWIPSPLPENVKMIVSFKRGDEQTEEYYFQQEADSAMILHSVKPFDSKDDRKKLVTAYLERFFKELDEGRTEALISSTGADNPLFLKVALAELRVFGVHNDLTVMIKNNFGNTPVKAFDAVLSRMESDPAYSKISPEILLPHLLGWIAHSHYGLSIEELSDLLIREKLTDNKDDANDAIYLVLRQLHPYLAKRDGRVDFFYDSFKSATTERYTVHHKYAREITKWHRSLAEYFETLPFENKHKLMEQAWQYAHAEMLKPLTDLFFNHNYLESYLVLLNCSQLVEEFKLVENFKTDPEEKDSILLLRDCLSLSTGILNLNPKQIGEQIWGRIGNTSNMMIKNLLYSISNNKKNIWFRPIVPCMSNTFSGLTQIIYTEHAKSFYIAPITGNGKFVYAIDKENLLIKIDIGTNKVVKKYNLYLNKFTDEKDEKPFIRQIVLCPNETNIIVCIKNATFLRINLTNGQCEAQFIPSESEQNMTVFNKISFSTDGKYFHFVNSNRIYVFEADTLKLLNQIKMVCPNYKHYAQYENWFAVFGYNFSQGKYTPADIQVVNVNNGQIDTLPVKKIEYERAEFSTDGKYLLGISNQGIISKWDITTRQVTHCLTGINEKISCIRFMPDNKHLITSSSEEKNLRIWDTETFTCRCLLQGHTKDIIGFSLSADSKICISTAEEDEVLVWNLNLSFDNNISSVSHSRAVQNVSLVQNFPYLISSSYPVCPLNDLQKNPNKELNGDIKIWDKDTGMYLNSNVLPSIYETDSVKFTSDGNNVAGWFHQVWTKDGMLSSGIKIWELKTSDKGKINVIPSAYLELWKDNCLIWAPQPKFSEDGCHIFKYNEIKNMLLLNIVDVKKKRKQTLNLGQGNAEIDAICALQKNHFIVAYNNGILAWINLSKKIIYHKIKIKNSDPGKFKKLYLSQDGKKLFCLTTKQFLLLDAENGKQIQDLGRQMDYIQDFAVARNGDLLFVHSFFFDEKYKKKNICSLSLWNVSSNSKLSEIFLETNPCNLVCEESGNHIYYGDETGRVCFISLENIPVYSPKLNRRSESFVSKFFNILK